MKFGILILSGPYNYQSSDTAYLFIQTALKKGHKVLGVFFYHNGVQNANRFMQVPKDERNIASRWEEVGNRGVPIYICIAAAQKRGIHQGLLIKNSQITGLGDLMMLADECDQLISFGN